MFIEITEILRCPRDHAESYMICGPVTMDGRNVARGGLSCPVCGADYPILDGVAWFGPADEPVRGAIAAPPSALTSDGIQTFLGLEGGGGYLLLVGSVGRLGAELAASLPNTGIVGVNPPPDVVPAGLFSVLRSPRALPVRRHSVRGVVVGADAAVEPWLRAAIDTVLTGLRIVVEDEATHPAGVVHIARGAGVFVGERRTA